MKKTEVKQYTIIYYFLKKAYQILRTLINSKNIIDH